MWVISFESTTHEAAVRRPSTARGGFRPWLRRIRVDDQPQRGGRLRKFRRCHLPLSSRSWWTVPVTGRPDGAFLRYTVGCVLGQRLPQALFGRRSTAKKRSTYDQLQKPYV